jgi:hypothetical protein
MRIALFPICPRPGHLSKNSLGRLCVARTPMNEDDALLHSHTADTQCSYHGSLSPVAHEEGIDD